MTSDTPRLSRGRKSRGRGLRTNTGCATCRKRHLKCDEAKPICGPCLRVSRQCDFAQSSKSRDPVEHSVDQPDEDEATEDPSQIPNTPAHYQSSTAEPDPDVSPTLSPPQNHRDPAVLAWTPGQDQSGLHPLDQLAAIVAIDQTTSPFANGLAAAPYPSDIPHSVTASVESPGPTVNAATVKWFDLLANDAVRESPHVSTALGGYGQASLEEANEEITPLQRATRIVDRNHQPEDVAMEPSLSGHLTRNLMQPVLDGQNSNSPGSLFSEERLWRAQESIKLLPQEYSLFENFVQYVSPWIDLFDPTNKFSTFVPHLAMRNAGLLNAILALSSRHLSLNSDAHNQSHREASLQYYYQTLHYVQKAMQYSSYKTSLELLATTLIISTYEMLDDSSQDWQRHLEGVFLIQRSQVIHGDSGGLKAAVWWAWLCQDVWAAFRERRKTLTFWVPKKTYADLSPAEIAARSVFIFAKVVNFCSREECLLAEMNAQARTDKAKHLRDMLDEWWSHLTVEFSPLPLMAPSSSAAFQPLWIRTPAFAVAVQLHCVAHILVYSHEPCIGGLDQYLERQTRIQQCVEIVCGIAMTLKDDSSCVLSSQCLFIAGLFTQGSNCRNSVLDLLESCRQKTGWPIHSFGDELKRIWMAHESATSKGAPAYTSILFNHA
ncbi:fungal-specific transcription factor domain-containing protein [Aspergillus unguis]